MHLPQCYLKYDVSEIRFVLRPQVEATELGPIDIVSLCVIYQQLPVFIGHN
jgi:hypothetical protein